MISEYFSVVPAPLARRLQYHLLSSLILSLFDVVDLLLLRRHLLAFLVARSDGLRLIGVHWLLERIIVCKIIERVSRQSGTVQRVVVQNLRCDTISAHCYHRSLVDGLAITPVPLRSGVTRFVIARHLKERAFELRRSAGKAAVMLEDHT